MVYQDANMKPQKEGFVKKEEHKQHQRGTDSEDESSVHSKEPEMQLPREQAGQSSSSESPEPKESTQQELQPQEGSSKQFEQPPVSGQSSVQEGVQELHIHPEVSSQAPAPPRQDIPEDVQDNIPTDEDEPDFDSLYCIICQSTKRPKRYRLWSIYVENQAPMIPTNALYFARICGNNACKHAVSSTLYFDFVVPNSYVPYERELLKKAIKNSKKSKNNSKKGG